MDKNYTPLDIGSLRSPHKSFDLTVVFLTLIILTLGIMVALLFILIQKKVQELGLVAIFA